LPKQEVNVESLRHAQLIKLIAGSETCGDSVFQKPSAPLCSSSHFTNQGGYLCVLQAQRIEKSNT